MINIGIDVGSTFTDVVCFNETDGDIKALKVPSTPDHENEGFIAGFRELNISGATVQNIIHGTTVATNALLQKKGSKVAMVTTAGFKDLIEIGRSRRYKQRSLFDPKFIKTEPLIDRPLRLEIKERIGKNGEIIAALTREEMQRVKDRLSELSVDVVAICLLNSYVNDTHERQLLEYLTTALPQVHVCISTEAYAGIGEFERFSTAVMNAYLISSMAGYIRKLEEELRNTNVKTPILIMGSDGGCMSTNAAARNPVRTILSGPAGGVIAAIRLAEILEIGNLITYDMGGTSTDVAVIRNSLPIYVSEQIYAALPIMGSMIEINTVGAGAGSIAELNSRGSISVGPESVRAVPGPACYGLGGLKATVTDANLVLGRLKDKHLLGEHLFLHKEKAEVALSNLAEHIDGLTIKGLAEGIIKIAVTKMVGAIREISVERGLDPREFPIIAYGGAGPMHAAFVAAELGGNQVIVPPLPGNFSALGLISADIRYEQVQTVLVQVDEAGLLRISNAIRSLSERCRTGLKEQGVPSEAIEFEIWLNMHYSGQAAPFAVRLFEIVKDPEELSRLFLERYEERYGSANPNRKIDIDSVRIVGVARKTKPPLYLYSSRSGNQKHKLKERRDVVFDGASHLCNIYDRETMEAGEAIDGPAIVEENGATTVVPPAWHCLVDKYGNLRLTANGVR